tara:strand:- start:1048 stop:2424 length:1377 start_codon:yes stop_codon:yes gene_type:complete
MRHSVFSRPRRLGLALTLGAIAACATLPATEAQPAPATQSAAPAATGEAALWREDADAFLAVLLAEHEDPFFATPEPEFRAAFEAYLGGLETMNRSERIVGLARIVALVGDGHTWMPMHALPFDGMPPGPTFSSLPVRFEWFEDGLFIVGAAQAHRAALGARIIAIGDTGTQAAVDRAMTMLPRDAVNLSSEFVAEWLMQREILDTLGLATPGEEVRLTLEINGRRETLSLEALPPAMQYDWIFSSDGGPTGPDGALDWYTAAAATPLWREPTDPLGWTVTLDNAAYLQINQIAERDPGGYAGLAQTAVDQAEGLANPVLVIDLRQSLGGDGSLNDDLVAVIRDNPQINRPGHLFVLTSRMTHSAAIMLVSKLEQQTHARFYGQATADRPNHNGETNIFITPNSHLPILHASEYYQTVAASDTRRFRTPDVTIPYRFSDYRTGHDPVLAAVLDSLQGH